MDRLVRGRLAGRVRSEAQDLAYVRIGNELWDQGPAAVNAEIKRRIEELEPPPSAVQRAQINRLIEAPEPPPSTVQLGASITAAASGRASLTITAPPLPLSEAIPDQTSAATNFRINSEGLIDVVPDPPSQEIVSDALQQELYSELRRKATNLSALGGNLLGDAKDPIERFGESLPEQMEDLSIIRSWSRGNSLRSRLTAHDHAMESHEPDPARLAPLVSEALRDLIHTWNVFIVGDPKGRELDEIRFGPQEAAAARQATTAAAPIVAAIEQSENVATPSAEAAVVEQARAARDAPSGINGDQANDLSRKTTGNFVIQLVRSGYSALRGEPGFAWKEYRAGIYHEAGAATVRLVAWSAILSFIVANAEALRKFVSVAFHNPALSEIIEYIVRALT